jgi:hypothetical protein
MIGAVSEPRRAFVVDSVAGQKRHLPKSQKITSLFIMLLMYVGSAFTPITLHGAISRPRKEKGTGQFWSVPGEDKSLSEYFRQLISSQ